MRLLFVSHSIPAPGQALENVGGMQRVATDLYAALEQHPDVSLDALLLRTSWRWTHVLTGPFLASLLWRIPTLAHRRGIDVVLFSSMVTAAVSPLLAGRLRRLGVSMAAIAHGRDVTLPNPAYQQLLPRVFDALDLVLPVSRATGEASRTRGLPPEKLHVVPNGIETDRFPWPIDKQAARARLAARLSSFGLQENDLLLCSVGRQVERKGFGWFIEQVMPALPEDIRYVLAGEGPETDRIRSKRDELGLGNRVALLGRVDDDTLHLLYRAADLFVMPNVPVSGDMEGFGVVMLEAGLNGLPAIASNLEGIRDVICEGENGHLLQPGDAAAFRQTIMSYAGQCDRLRRDGERARTYVASTFSWDRVADRYVQALTDTLDLRQSAAGGRRSEAGLI